MPAASDIAGPAQALFCTPRPIRTGREHRPKSAKVSARQRRSAGAWRGSSPCVWGVHKHHHDAAHSWMFLSVEVNAVEPSEGQGQGRRQHEQHQRIYQLNLVPPCGLGPFQGGRDSRANLSALEDEELNKRSRRGTRGHEAKTQAEACDKEFEGLLPRT